MTAYYNEYDPFAAQWLMALIADGQIAPGVVDTRSITEVTADDVRGFTQVHLFAGIGVWSLAARRAGWADDRPLWTGSCPCPPFSSAGKSKACPSCGGTNPVPHVGRTGYFVCCLCGGQWLADERHLWPEMWRLVRDVRPVVVCGEQVASADGRVWLDLVRASLEMLAYDPWAVDLCASGFGAPHIRQRLYWMADTGRPERRALAGGRGDEFDGTDARGPETTSRRKLDSATGGVADTLQSGRAERRPVPGYGSSAGSGEPDRLVDTGESGLEGYGGDGGNGHQSGRLGTIANGSTAASGVSGGLVDTDRSGAGAQSGDYREAGGETARGTGPDDRAALPLRAGSVSGLADDDGNGRSAGRTLRSDGAERDVEYGRTTRIERPGPTNGYWRDADWLSCRDEKWRPVESPSLIMADDRDDGRTLAEGGGTYRTEGEETFLIHFPLAESGTYKNRVQELRGAGNAINLAQAEGFIRAFMEVVR